MWAMTNPTRTTPVTAITTFLPTVVPHKATTGLVGQTRPTVGAGRARVRSPGFFDNLLFGHRFFLDARRDARARYQINHGPGTTPCD